MFVVITTMRDVVRRSQDLVVPRSGSFSLPNGGCIGIAIGAFCALSQIRDVNPTVRRLLQTEEAVDDVVDCRWRGGARERGRPAEYCFFDPFEGPFMCIKYRLHSTVRPTMLCVETTF